MWCAFVSWNTALQCWGRGTCISELHYHVTYSTSCMCEETGSRKFIKLVAACAQPPSITDKVKEVFGLSEAINPESRNLGPNEVGKDAIDEISAYASNADKATPGAALAIDA